MPYICWFLNPDLIVNVSFTFREEVVEFVAPKYMKGCNTHAKGLTLENLEAGFNSLDPLESGERYKILLP